MFEFTVDERTAGQRPDRALRTVMPAADREFALAALKSGRIAVNGMTASLKTVLAAGDVVRAEVEDKSAAPSKRTETQQGFGLLHLDAHVCVVDKPQGIATHHAPGVEDGVTLLDLVEAYLAFKDITPSRPPLAAGRLDRGTTGVLVISLSREAERGLAAAFEADTIRKEYLALCHGVTQPTLEVDRPLVVSRYRRGEAKVKKLKDAVTHATRLAHSQTASLLRVELDTGRMHQIRRHLRSVNHPVVGDSRYGRRQDRESDELCLHAWSVTFTHPVDGRVLQLRAPLPAHFKRALKTHQVAWKER